ncbi:MAG: hypothetical protein J7J78_00885 [Thermoprotei archaeon]|nr:hypothetical protein [Thermoprotei archaeon]
MRKSFLRNKKALSPIIATLLLVSISIAGVLVVYRFMNTVATASTTVLSLQTIDKQLKILSDGSAAFYISTKNVGNTELKVIEISIGNFTDTFATPEELRSGDTFTYSKVISPTQATFERGYEYPVIIKVKTPDGSVKVFQEIVKAE